MGRMTIKGDTLKLGVDVKSSEVFRVHHQLRANKVELLRVEFDSDPEEFLSKYGGGYSIIPRVPNPAGMFHPNRNEDFAWVDAFMKMFYQNMDLFEGVSVELDHLYGMDLADADSHFNTVFMKRHRDRLVREYKRIFLTATSTVNADEYWPVSYPMALTRSKQKHKLVHAGYDTESAHWYGSLILKATNDLTIRRMRTLADQIGLLVLSGVGDVPGDRVSIYKCKQYSRDVYLDVLNAFKNSFIIVSGGDINDKCYQFRAIMEEMGR